MIINEKRDMRRVLAQFSFVCTTRVTSQNHNIVSKFHYGYGNETIKPTTATRNCNFFSRSNENIHEMAIIKIVAFV